MIALGARFRAASAVVGIAAAQFAALAITAGDSSADGAAPTCSATVCTRTFGYTGADQTFTVPADVRSLTVTTRGAAGGLDGISGKGGTTTGTLAVTPGRQLTVVVGQVGQEAGTTPTYGGGGPVVPNTLGATASSGGGGSFVFDGTDLLLAGGGGGGHSATDFCGTAYGADGGGDTGVDGHPCASNVFYFTDGTGGSQSAGGKGGDFSFEPDKPGSTYGAAKGTDGTGPAHGPHTPGQGGTGGWDMNNLYPGGGGGGGGGYFGGGGGAFYQGGGGGSGYAAPSATSVSSTTGTNDAPGSVTFTWTPPPVTQQLLVTSAPSANAVVGESHALSITGGASSSAIAVTSADDSVCSVTTVTDTVVGGKHRADTTVGFDRSGTCRLTITQAGGSGFVAADPAEITVTVAARPTTTTVDLSTSSAVYGQAATATVHTTPGVAGTVTLTQTRNGVASTGSGVHVPASGDGTTTISLAGAVGTTRVSARFVPDDLGLDAESSTSIDPTLVVRPAEVAISLKVSPERLVATVSAVAPSTAVPTGTVQFGIADEPLGSPVPLDAQGVAALDVRIPAGRVRHVQAVYSGQPNDDGTVSVAPSSTSTARRDPVVHSAVVSDARRHHGWYRDAATVHFTCRAGSADLVRRCPAPVTVRGDGVHTVTRTVRATDGGVTTLTRVVRIDRTRPTVALRGVRPGRVYGTLPRVRCSAGDATSGVSTCRLTRRVHGDKVTYTALATDVAGHTRRTHVTVVHPALLIVGASYSGARPVVRDGRTYTLVVRQRVRPSYVYSAPDGVRPAGDGGRFVALGAHRWAYAVTFYRTPTYAVWNFGVRTGTHTRVVSVRIT